MPNNKKTPAIRFKGFTDDWEQRELITIAEVLDGDRGKNYPTESDFTASGHTLFLNASNVTKDGFSFVDNQYISEEKSDSMGNGKLQEDDIIVTSRGSLGHIAWYNDDIMRLIRYARINSGMLILRKKIFLNSSYLYQFMKSPKGQEQISFISFGSAQPQLTKAGVEKLNIDLPNDLEEQTKIGSFFSQLDNLITLHQRKCDKLIQFKTAMLQKMFPQNGADKPEIRFRGFTDAWEQRKLGELGEVITGSTPSTSHEEYYSADGIPWVTPTDITENVIYDTPRKLSDEGQKVGRVVPKGTILVTCIASIGKNTILGTTGSFNQQINGLVPDFNKFVPYFLFTESTLWSEKMKRQAAAGTMQIVNKTEFSELETSVPNYKEQEKIGTFFSNLDSLITLHQRKCDKYKSIKAGLIRKLFP